MKKRASILVIVVFAAGCSREPIGGVVAVHETGPGTSTVANPKPEQPNEVQAVSGYPDPETWTHAGRRQRDRAARSFARLKERKVPVLSGPLFVDDDDAVTLQTAQEVARRTLVLYAVELRAEGVPQKEMLELLNRHNLWGSVSPEEKRFLNDKEPDPQECQDLVWRLESIWVLMWALGYIDELDWPSGMCDVPKLVALLEPHESNPKFITEAKLRSKAEILDAQDVTMRIHWAIRDALLHRGGKAPLTLDWRNDDEWTPVTAHAAVGVVEQRHYVLNWLTRFLDPEDWDNVDTPT